VQSAAGRELHCIDRHAEVAAAFLLDDVQTYTANDAAAEEIKDEACEDLTVI